MVTGWMSDWMSLMMRLSPTSCFSEAVGMRVASVRILYIPATTWLSLSCGMGLLSATVFITSVQSFPSMALTTTAYITNTSTYRLAYIYMCVHMELPCIHTYTCMEPHACIYIHRGDLLPYSFICVYLLVFSWTFPGPHPSDFSTGNLPREVSCFRKTCSSLHVLRPLCR